MTVKFETETSIYFSWNFPVKSSTSILIMLIFFIIIAGKTDGPLYPYFFRIQISPPFFSSASSKIDAFPFPQTLL